MSKKETIELLKKYDFIHKYEDLRKAYDNDPRLRHESFEDFCERCRKIKVIIDEIKYHLRVRGEQK